MAELKTKKTEIPVSKFLDTVPDEETRNDCFAISRLMEKVTGFPPKMWGSSIVGFGQYHYKYESGHEGDMCLVGFSPRKQNISLYVTPEPELLEKLGKHKASKACVYVKRLKDIDLKVLEKLIKVSVKSVQQEYHGK